MNTRIAVFITCISITNFSSDFSSSRGGVASSFTVGQNDKSKKIWLPLHPTLGLEPKFQVNRTTLRHNSGFVRWKKVIFLISAPVKYFNQYIFSMCSSSRFICRITTYWEISFDFFGLQTRCDQYHFIKRVFIKDPVPLNFYGPKWGVQICHT